MAPMRIALITLHIASALLLAGCSTISQQAIYEGLRTQRNTEAAGTNPAPAPLPNYERYQREREQAK